MKQQKLKTKGSHFTQTDRAKIEYGLNKGHSIRAISKDLNKAPSSVKREIERNFTIIKNYANACAKIDGCSVRHVCGRSDCNRLCRNACRLQCHKWCSEYEESSCPRLDESPHLCNSCPNLNRRVKGCTFTRHVYYADQAHQRYKSTLHDKRAGFDLTLGEIIGIDNVVSPLIKKGQSPYHIMQNNVLPISLSTLYRIVHEGEITATDTDLKQKVRRKPRKTQRHGEKLAKRIHEAKIGHMYEDFLKYMSENDTFHVEMDCVLGKLGEPPAILTLHYPGLQMQLAFYLEDKTAFNVVLMLDNIEKVLGSNLFNRAFPVILTDNGGEFADVQGIERSVFNHKRKRTALFFCEPNRSDEKGSCENNHKLIREVIPKSTSLIPYTQADLTLMMNHINSYCRKKSFGKCAYDLAMEVFPERFFDLLGLFKIHANEVVLKPSLLNEAFSKANK